MVLPQKNWVLQAQMIELYKSFPNCRGGESGISSCSQLRPILVAIKLGHYKYGCGEKPLTTKQVQCTKQAHEFASIVESLHIPGRKQIWGINWRTTTETKNLIAVLTSKPFASLYTMPNHSFCSSLFIYKGKKREEKKSMPFIVINSTRILLGQLPCGLNIEKLNFVVSI